MFQFILKKASQYLVFLACCFVAVIFITMIIQTQKEFEEKTISNEIEKSYLENIIYLDNFPVENGALSSSYGMRADPFSGKKRMHHGIDIKASRGASVFPIGRGTVIFSGRKAGFGNVIEIQHGSTIVSRYAHLKKSFVKKNQKVFKEDIIAQVGNSGRSTGPHLHLEIAINDEMVDPKIFMIGGLASK